MWRIALAAVLAAGCHKSDCRKFAEQLTSCHLSYGPTIIDTQGQVEEQIEGYCDTMCDRSDAMKSVVKCVVAAGSCDAIAACLE